MVWHKAEWREHEKVLHSARICLCFLVLSDSMESYYECKNFYHPNDESSLGLNLSGEDQKWLGLADALRFDNFEYYKD